MGGKEKSHNSLLKLGNVCCLYGVSRRRAYVALNFVPKRTYVWVGFLWKKYVLNFFFSPDAAG